MSVHIAPSILAADFFELKPQLEPLKFAGVNVLHVDVMDGHFVNNISVGTPVVESLRGKGFALDVHLMIIQPWRYAERFIRSGADWLTVHLEAVPAGRVAGLMNCIKALGGKPGLSISPTSDVDGLAPYLTLCDQVLIMTVTPGFGGQKYDAQGNARIARAKELINQINPNCLLSVDGGIDRETAFGAAKAGAERLVAGSAVFKTPDTANAAVELLRVAMGR